MRIIVLGGDGYLGWPTAMHFARKGHEVVILDNLSKRRMEEEVAGEPLFRRPTLQKRVRLWREVKFGREIILPKLNVLDIASNYGALLDILGEFKPQAIVHYAEQPSAPYSMISCARAVNTEVNNIAGTLNVLHAMKNVVPEAHLVKLGTMGEYGTPDIDIEEGWIDIEHKGRKARMLYPKQPGSFYHASKVADSVNIEFACRVWGLRATDLNQGVVYGIDTPETKLHPELVTSFHYDAVFGTALNRFIVQAVAGIPLTVYGKGGQKRGFLNIMDTLQCVEIAVMNPAKEGEFRVFNQFTETFSVMELANLVSRVASKRGYKVSIDHIKNPRVEKEEHYYNAVNSALFSLGLKPHLLTEEVVDGMMQKAHLAVKDIDLSVISPNVFWRRS
ncbi:MAG: NAD-dependent epimerase/dehydratase family protein [bacterium]|nr:NAD-dependent epimerase/dehydratase family protein [bacterium]